MKIMLKAVKGAKEGVDQIWEYVVKTIRVLVCRINLFDIIGNIGYNIYVGKTHTLR